MPGELREAPLVSKQAELLTEHLFKVPPVIECPILQPNSSFDVVSAGSSSPEPSHFVRPHRKRFPLLHAEGGACSEEDCRALYLHQFHEGHYRESKKQNKVDLLTMTSKLLISHLFNLPLVSKGLKFLTKHRPKGLSVRNTRK